jgi:hypothetical protein
VKVLVSVYYDTVAPVALAGLYAHTVPKSDFVEGGGALGFSLLWFSVYSL